MEKSHPTSGLWNSVSSLKRRVLGSRFVHALRNNPISLLGIAIICLFLLVVVCPDALTRCSPVTLNLRDRLMPPSYKHYFGTDGMGRDVYSRVIHGAGLTLRNVVVVLALAIAIGPTLGSVAGYFGGKVDTAFMFLTDVFLAFPPLILAVAINSALGRGLLQTMLAVGFSWWPGYARLVRGQVLSVKNEDYIMAVRATGAGSSRIITRHVLPNCIAPVIVKITLDVGYVALTTGALSFLGLGAEPPTPEWGRMISEGRSHILDAWWIATFPGLALFLVVVGFNLFGEAVRDWLDPRSVGKYST